MQNAEPKTVLILCTGNSCRSQMAQVIWNEAGQGNWRAESAGSRPSGDVHPLAMVALQEIGMPTAGLHSKSADSFQQSPFDLVVTVCDDAQQACPIWPSAKTVLHWPFPDPADATGTDDQKLVVFRAVRDQIRQKITDWLQNNPAP